MWNDHAGTGRRRPPVLPFLPLLLVLLLPSVSAAGDEEGCLFCHRLPLLSAAGGAARSLRVADPPGAFHGTLYCSDCHGDARTAPHAVRPGPTNCVAPCHAAAEPPGSHRRAAWGGLTETHRSISQPLPPCLLCHLGSDPKGEREAIAARCAACHPRHASTVHAGVHSPLAAGDRGGACSPCHPAHDTSRPGAAAGGADGKGEAKGGHKGVGKDGATPSARCAAPGCHAKVTAAMTGLGGHRGAPSLGRGAAAALLALSLLLGIAPGFLFPPAPPLPHGTRQWVTAPERIPRYTLAMRIQHLAATLLFLALLASAAARAFSPGAASHRVHALAGIAASLLLVLHGGYLLLRGVRLDLPLSDVAFLPFRDPPAGEGKYSRSERWDYLLLLLLGIAVAATGILLRWPGTIGIPAGAYGAVRTVHLLSAAAAAAYVLGTHGRLRLLRGAEGAPLSIVTGYVPLAAAASRPGWTGRLVEAGVLVPVPEEKGHSEEAVQGALVRDLLEEGNRSARAGDFAAARAKFAEALVHYPDYAQARFNLAVACMKGGDRAEAAAQFAAFLAADPFNPMAEKAREYLEACRRDGGKP